MPFQSEKQRRYLHANHPEIAKRWERDYGEGGIAALNAQLNQLPEYYLPAAQGGRIGFHRGSLRHQKTHDYKAYSKPSDYLMQAPPENWLSTLLGQKKMSPYMQERDAFESWQKERFMYGEPTQKKSFFSNLNKGKMDQAINAWIKSLFIKEKKNGEDFIDDEELTLAEELNLAKGGRIGFKPGGRTDPEGGLGPGQQTTGDIGKTGWGGGGGNGGTGGGGHHPPVYTGPTPEEIAAAKAAEAAKQKAIADAEYKNWWEATKEKKKEKVKHQAKIFSTSGPVFDEKLGWINPDTEEPIDMTMEGVQLAKVYGKPELTKWGATPGRFKDTAKFNDMEKYQELAIEQFNAGKPIDQIKESIEIGSSLYGIDMDNIPEDFYSTKEDFENQKILGDIKFNKGGIANHFKKRVKLQDSVESLSDTEFQTMYPDWNPDQFTREEYLQLISENEGNGVLDLNPDDQPIEFASTEENEIIPDLLAPGSAAGILRLKDGGIPQLARKSKSGKRPGYGGPQDWGQEARGTGAYSGPSEPSWEGGGYDQPSAPETKTVERGDASIAEQIAAEDRQRREDIKDIIARGDEEKYDTEEQKIQDKWTRHNRAGETRRHTYITTQKQQAVKAAEDALKAKLKKTGKSRLLQAIVMVIAGVPLKSVATTFVKKDDFKTVLRFAIPIMQAKKEYKTALENAKAVYEELGMPEFHHAVDTPLQDINQQLLDLTQRPDEDDPGPDGPPLTIDVLAETKEEIEEAPDMISMMDKIRAGQAKRAMLVEKDIIQESPIVDESGTDIMTMANKGGLANLFRVKNP